jgi:hypothetical protein
MAGELQHGAGMPARAVLVRWHAGVLACRADGILEGREHALESRWDC